MVSQMALIAYYFHEKSPGEFFNRGIDCIK